MQSVISFDFGPISFDVKYFLQLLKFSEAMTAIIYIIAHFRCFYSSEDTVSCGRLKAFFISTVSSVYHLVLSVPRSYFSHVLNLHWFAARDSFFI